MSVVSEGGEMKANRRKSSSAKTQAQSGNKSAQYGGEKIMK
jgi:hypothetical protein